LWDIFPFRNYSNLGISYCKNGQKNKMTGLVEAFQAYG
jgi:hypothetical protein